MQLQREEHYQEVGKILKRFLDIIGSSIGILLVLPLFLLIPVLIKMESEGPVIYRRRVVGKNGISFDAFKFRSMVEDADTILKNTPELNQRFLERFKLKDDPRITKIGFLLRKYSFDELPQLINVLVGQMSLVGPRMMTAPELEQYGKWRQVVLSVRPGLTGLWQVSGRQDVSPQRRIELDVAYVTNWSMLKDMVIIFKTFFTVLKAEGAY